MVLRIQNTGSENINRSSDVELITILLQRTVHTSKIFYFHKILVLTESLVAWRVTDYNY